MSSAAPALDPVDTCSGWCSDHAVHLVVGTVIVAVAILLFVCGWILASRIRKYGTIWHPSAEADDHNSNREVTMMPMAWRNTFSRRNREANLQGYDDERDPVPSYHRTPWNHDAGFYDSAGNFIPYGPPPYEPPKPVYTQQAHPSVETTETSTHSTALWPQPTTNNHDTNNVDSPDGAHSGSEAPQAPSPALVRN